MLLEFTVENFLSFKDRTTFSMVASIDKKQINNIIEFKKINLLKSAVVYGANASGKTNLINALYFVNHFVRNSHKNQAGEEIVDLVPFKLEEAYINKPSRFEIIFAKNGIKYIYGFSADRTKVYDEYLFYYPHKKPAKIFERHNTNDYSFTIDIREQKELSKRTLDNALYLSSSSNWNYINTKQAFEWFVDRLRIIKHDVYGGYTAKLFNDDIDLAKSIREFIAQADVGILDLRIAIKKISEETIPKDFPDELKKLMLDKGGQTAEVKAIHLSKDAEGTEKKMEFDLHQEESEGTIKMFNLAGPFIDVLKNGRILVIDEMDTKLHPLLTKCLVDIFHNQNRNKNNAQLIFTTHNTYLLGEKIFRRDQIWYASKRSDQSTELYSLYDYKARDDENIEKRYLAGRYGAIPLLF